MHWEIIQNEKGQQHELAKFFSFRLESSFWCDLSSSSEFCLYISKEVSNKFKSKSHKQAQELKLTPYKAKSFTASPV